MVVWRYTSAGALDTSFDGDGIAVFDNAAGGNGDDWGQGITIDDQGRILVSGGSVNAAGNNDMALWRLNSNGSLDTSFNNDGFVTHNNAAGGNDDDEGGFSILIDDDGKIWVPGTSTNAAGNLDMVLWRFDTNGNLDTSYDGDGFYIEGNVAGGNNIDYMIRIAFDSDNNIIGVGGGRLDCYLEQ